VPPSLNFSQLDFVEPSSGFHPVTWERVTTLLSLKHMRVDGSRGPLFLIN
jgi:hypothetical protein